ncbi:hypothetical protein C0Q70_14284 [Pomacea canaliculata]|uniref:Glycosyl hydrolase family 13 catalytic domain-containing protein n=1 Tax=Pomacea canaliculata TaxID=400727 RepID=A0A2T7NZL2_POMCA|nr:hypothetical protein C0Q70_14284 [Pomacea canaliculata]
MADSNAVEEKNKANDPEAAFEDDILDDSKAKFINGGKSQEDSTVVEVSSASEPSFTGLGKDELRKYAEDPFWVRLRWVLFILFVLGWLAMLVAAIVIIVLAPRCPSRPDLKWYHKEAAYNVYTKSFLDGGDEKDGYGDLKGVIKKESYIQNLGAKTIWLSSIFKTDGDNDAAVVDFMALDEKFGTIDDFKTFLKALAKKDRKVIIDFDPNQTSQNHTWFQKSQKNEAGYENFYVWANSSNNWKQDDGSSAWSFNPIRKQYFLHQVSNNTADLNLRSKEVRDELKKIMEYWTGIGVSGFNIAGVQYLTENSTFIDDDGTKRQTRNFPDNGEIVAFLPLVFTSINEDSIDQLDMLFGTDERKGFHFVSVVLDKLDSSKTANGVTKMLQPYVNASSNRWLGWQLSSPYVSRVGQRLQDRVTIGHALQALLPGTALPYYGDEIAMIDGPTLTAQLSESGNSLMSSFTQLMQLRSNESLQFGQTQFCTTDDLLIFSRHAKGFAPYMVVINMGKSATAHSFVNDKCIGGKTAEVVFHSHNEDHMSKIIDVEAAVAIGSGEVLVLKFSP